MEHAGSMRSHCLLCDPLVDWEEKEEEEEEEEGWGNP